MTTPDKREIWPDVIRVCAAFFVVMIHCGARGVNPAEWVHGGQHTLAVAFYTTLAKPSVIWFFMLSGYLLLGKQENLADFFRKRFSKVLVPILVFSAIYLLIDNKLSISNKTDIYQYISSGTYFHLWFLHALLCCYLTIPILRKICEIGKLSLPIYLFILWLFFSRWMPLENRILGVTESVFGIQSTHISQFAGYLLLGWLVGRITLNKHQTFWVIIAWIATSSAAWFAAISGPPWETFGWNYTSPFLMLSATAGFILLKQCAMFCSHINPPKIISALSPLSLGIYLVHPMLLRPLSLHGKPSVFTWLEIPLNTCIIFSASALLVYLIRLSELGKRLLP